MRQVILSDVCDISSGGTPSRNRPDFFKGHIPWVKISDIENSEAGIVYDTEEMISEDGLKNIRGRTFPTGTLLFAMYGSIGKTAIAGKELSTNQAILGIRPKKPGEVDINYLRCWFDSNKQKLINKGRGVALKNLSATIVRNLEVDLPLFDDQARISQLLGRAEGLIHQRKRHLQGLADLLKSVFIDMFGPQAAGYAGWPSVEIKDLAASHKGAMRTGPFGSNLLHGEFTTEGDVAVLGIDNAVQNRFAWGERRFITQEKYKELESYRIWPGDVIVTIMGTIGRSAVIPNDIPLAINTKHLAAITLDRDLANPLFLSYSIHSSPFVLRQLQGKNRGAIMSGLNLGIIKEIKLKRPPIKLQNEFAEIHEHIDRMRTMYQQSQSELEVLYAALSQSAFKGQLDLSRVPLPGVIEGERTVATVRVSEQAMDSGIDLPYTELLLLALENRGNLKPLLNYWLETYRAQSAGREFSVERFLETVNTRVAELQPDADFELGAEAYEHVKGWVFEALSTGSLQQVFDDEGNRVRVVVAPA